VSNCGECGEREAVVHVTTVKDGEVRTVGLCDQCAAAKGIPTSTTAEQSPLGGFLSALWKTAEAPEGQAPMAEHCPGCGARFQDFRSTGRLGCAECWRTFEPALRQLIRRYHGSTVHHGRRHSSPGVGPEAMRASEIESLREQLRLAVQAENFELAAELRDRLKELHD
jgi:protein arginine kinase activator